MSKDTVGLTVRDCLLLLVVCLVAYFHGIGRLQLKHEEPRRALVARTTLATGDWIVPTLNGRPYLGKPPLFTIQIAALSKISGGVTETTARLPSALAVLGITLLVYWTGSSLANPRTGLYAGLMTASCGLFLEKGPLAEIDMSFALWVVASLFLQFRAFHGRGRFEWAAAYLALTLAFLTKGPPALLFFIGGSAALLWMGRTVAPLRTARHLSAIPIFVVPVALWLWAVLHQAGVEALMESTAYELSGRGLEWSVLNPLNHLYYPLRIAAGFLPWTPLLVLAVILIRPPDASRSRLTRFCLYASLAAVILFSLSAGKASRYMLPILPLLALVCGDLLDRLGSGQLNADKTRVTRIVMAVTAIFALAGALALGPVAAVQWDAPAAKTILISVAAIAIAAGGGFALVTRSDTATLAMIVAVACLYRLTYVEAYVPFRNDRESIRPIVEPINRATADGGPVYAVGWWDYRIFFAMDADVLRLDSVDEVAARTRPGEPIHCFVYSQQRGSLESAAPRVWRASASFESRGRDVILLSGL